jgi:hypothetical protein
VKNIVVEILRCAQNDNITCLKQPGIKLTGGDVGVQKLVISHPKSGKETEVVFIPKKLADRPKDYLKASGIEGEQRIFPITYTATRVMVRKAGAMVGPILGTRPEAACGNLCLEIRGARGDRQQGHTQASQPLHRPKGSREGQRCGSGEVDREFIRLMVGNRGKVVEGLAHPISEEIFRI